MKDLKKNFKKWMDGENVSFTKDELQQLEKWNYIKIENGAVVPLIHKPSYEEKIKHGRIFIITTVVGCTKVSEKKLQTIKNFAKRNNAEIIIMGCNAHNKPLNEELWYSHLVEKIHHNVRLHPLLSCVDLKINPQQICPLNGLEEFSLNKKGERQSLIVATPKQDLKMIPYSNEQMPHLLYGTGTISEINYQENRIGKLAEQNHVYGGLIVEIKGSIFNIVNFQFDSEDCFIDRGVKYTQDNIEMVYAEAMIIGDLHAEEIDPEALKETLNQIKDFQPNDVFLHDIASWKSVNHFDAGSTLKQSLKLQQNVTFAEERIKVTSVLKRFTDTVSPWLGRINVVQSNHDDFVNKFLNDGRYAHDPVNHETAIFCIAEIYKGRSPYDYLFKGLPISWLKKEDDYLIHGIQCGSHGHLGVAGAKGNTKVFAKSYVNSITGHTHQANITHGAWSVGTISHIETGSHGYNFGLHSWTQTNAVIWENGTRQMLFLWNSFLKNH